MEAAVEELAAPHPEHRRFAVHLDVRLRIAVDLVTLVVEMAQAALPIGIPVYRHKGGQDGEILAFGVVAEPERQVHPDTDGTPCRERRGKGSPANSALLSPRPTMTTLRVLGEATAEILTLSQTLVLRVCWTCRPNLWAS